MSDLYKVAGMHCDGCARSVEKSIHALAPGASVTVDLDKGLIAVAGAAADQVARAVEDAGFDFGGAV